MSIRRTLAPLLLPATLLLVLCASRAYAQTPDSPLATDLPDSSATEVFVLGSPHLSNVADQFEPSMVDTLMTALEGFGPDAIAVERLPGRQVAAMERWGGPLKEVNQRYAGAMLHHGHLIREEAGWSWREANQRADSLLAAARSDSIELGAESRLALIRSLTASYRLPTASLHWKYLSPEARSSQSAVPDTTAEDLSERLGVANETYSIGMRLAHRLGHQRLYPIDDHAEEDLKAEIASAYNAVLDTIWNSVMKTHPTFQRTFKLQKSGLESGSLLPMYRYINTEEWSQDRVEMQWKEVLRRPTPENVGAAGVALYEARNLNMAAQIQRAVSQHPGGRVLVIVGASHKPFFDTYLRQMMGVKVIEAQEVIPGM